jgi:redox-sensitive bicupin YhaK (pirin superfamily)
VTRLAVFGVAFNPYDAAVLNLLKRAGPNIKSVLLVDVEPKIERLHQLWPDVMIKSCRSPEEGDSEIQKWLM